MLAFKDRQEYEEYLENLESYIKSELATYPDDDTIITIDSLLLQYEKTTFPGFKSYRNKSVNDFATMNEIGFDKLDEEHEGPQEHPFMDKYLESTLNDNSAVIIGDSIYMHPNIDVIIGFPKDKLDLYSFFNEIPDTQKETLDKIIYWAHGINSQILSGVSIFQASDFTRTLGTTGPGITLAESLSEIATITYWVKQQNPCDPFSWTANILIGSTKKSQNYYILGRTTIYWGDGTSTVIFSNTLNKEWHSGTLKHMYALGTYHPYAIIELALADGVGIGFAQETNTKSLGTVVVNNTLVGFCEEEILKDKVKHVKSTDGKAEIRCRVIGRSSGWANNIQAETEFWKLNNNNKWRKEKTNKYKRIYAKVESRLSFGECGEWTIKSKEDEETHKSSAFAVDRYGKRNPIKLNYVKGYHYAYYGNEKLELTQELPSCQ